MLTQAVNNIAIAYEVHGEGEPLLWLHGAYVSRRTWQPQIAHFAPHYRLILPDVRGHGNSGKSSAPYTMALFAQDMLALLDSLGIQRVVCVGHSMGGMVAQEMALMAPDRIRALVLAETSYGTSSTPLEAFATNSTKLFLPLLTVKTITRLSVQRYGKFSAEAVRSLEADMLAHTADRANFVNIFKAFLTFESKARLAQITRPTLVLVGSANKQTHGQGTNMAGLIKGARFEMIPNASHLLHWDNPDAFNAALTGFWAIL